jgi:hypothetical protein
MWEDNKLKDKDFIETVFEIAFGDDAINKGFTKQEVIAKIQEYSDNALLYEEVNT